jgi:SAM-dependent methyltransferase
MKDFWNERYGADDYAYGTEPNAFLKEVLASLQPGRILFPAEGEGRNAVYAATKDWQVDAFDLSEAGKQKATALAKKQQVTINYEVANFNTHIPLIETYDAVVLIFAHFPPEYRIQWHQKLIDALKPGGILILEAFSKDHLRFNSKNPAAGGPKNIDMLYDANTLRNDFDQLNEQLLEAKVVHLNEGPYHNGESAVIRYIGQKD